MVGCACLDCDQFEGCRTAPFCPDHLDAASSSSGDRTSESQHEWNAVVNQYLSAVALRRQHSQSDIASSNTGEDDRVIDLAVQILGMCSPDLEGLALKTEIIIRQFGDKDQIISSIFRDIVALYRKNRRMIIENMV